MKARGEFRPQIGHIMDVLPTLVAVSGAPYPAERHGVKIQPMEVRSLLPALQNLPIGRDALLCFEHEGSRAVRDGKWKLVSLRDEAWELYDLEADPTEMRNVASTMPEKARSLATLWEAWGSITPEWDQPGINPDYEHNRDFIEALQTAQQLAEWLEWVMRAETDIKPCSECPARFSQGCVDDWETCMVGAHKARSWLEGK